MLNRLQPASLRSPLDHSVSVSGSSRLCIAEAVSCRTILEPCCSLLVAAPTPAVLASDSTVTVSQCNTGVQHRCAARCLQRCLRQAWSFCFTAASRQQVTSMLAFKQYLYVTRPGICGTYALVHLRYKTKFRWSTIVLSAMCPRKILSQQTLTIRFVYRCSKLHTLQRIIPIHKQDLQHFCHSV